MEMEQRVTILKIKALNNLRRLLVADYVVLNLKSLLNYVHWRRLLSKIQYKLLLVDPSLDQQ